jgi:hypothetical protein
MLDGHRARASSSAQPPKVPSKISKSSLQGAPEGKARNPFPDSVKFPSLSDLKKLPSPYPPISTVTLQAKAAQCGVPPEEVTL